MESNKLIKRLFLVLKISISLLCILYVFNQVPISDVMHLFYQANPVWLIFGIVLFTFSKVLSSFRLNLFLKNINVHISEQSNLKLYWLGMFYNFFLPGGIGGDGYKVYLLSKQKEGTWQEITKAVLLDRIMGVLVLIALVSIFLFFLSIPVWVKWFVFTTAFASLVSYYLVLKFWLKSFIKSFISTNIYSLGVQVLQLLCAWSLLAAIGKFDNIPEYLTVFLVSSIVAVLPISIGGVGSREFTFLLASRYLDLTPSASLALSLSFYLVTLFVSSFGLIYLNKKIDFKNNKQVSII